MILKKLLIPAALLLFSLPALRARWTWERDRSVTLCVDGAELSLFHAPEEMPAVLSRLSAIGVRAVAVHADGGAPLGETLRPWTASLPPEMSVVLRPSFRKASEGGRAWRSQDFAGLPGAVTHLLPSGLALPFDAPDSPLRGALSSSNLLLPLVEFSQARPLEVLAAAFPDRVLRAHSIDEDEMLRLNPGVALARLRRAVRERGIRFLYVRFFPGLSAEANEAYLSRVSDGLRQDGFEPGLARPRLPSAPPSGRFPAPLRQALALLVAVLVPSLAFRATRRALPNPWHRPAALAAASLAAGLIIGALLSSGEFLLGFASFRGVKIALLLPLLLAAWETGRDLDLRAFLRRPLTIGAALLAAAAVLAAGVYLLRSGNDSALAASGLELRLREALESLLGVRPRFKEFALGYPLLWLAAYKDQEQKLWDLAWVGGMIAPLSVVNTFCHAHVPLSVSLLRTFHGFWLGAIGGAVLIFVVRAAAQRLSAVR